MDTRATLEACKITMHKASKHRCIGARSTVKYKVRYEPAEGIWPLGQHLKPAGSIEPGEAICHSSLD